MVRKGQVAEIFSRAIHNDNPELYIIGYINLGMIEEITLTKFLKLSENFQVIPASRIVYIKKENTTLYSKITNKKESP
jgi:hypothetical protein